MSASIIDMHVNDDVSYKCKISDQIVIVRVTRKAIEDAASGSDSYSEMSSTDKEKLAATILVWLSKKEAHGELADEYVLKSDDLIQLLGSN